MFLNNTRKNPRNSDCGQEALLPISPALKGWGRGRVTPGQWRDECDRRVGRVQRT